MGKLGKERSLIPYILYSPDNMNESAILCVDDEPTVLWCLRDQIHKNFGDRMICEIAESVDEAWEVITDLGEDGIKLLVIISDWLMPNVKGDEFLMDLHQKFPDVITIMLTGQADESAIERVQQHANLNAYVSKPWDEDHIVSLIRSNLQKVAV